MSNETKRELKALALGAVMAAMVAFLVVYSLPGWDWVLAAWDEEVIHRGGY